VTELRVEVQKGFWTPAAAPVRTVYADLEQDPLLHVLAGRARHHDARDGVAAPEISPQLDAVKQACAPSSRRPPRPVVPEGISSCPRAARVVRVAHLSRAARLGSLLGHGQQEACDGQFLRPVRFMPSAARDWRRSRHAIRRSPNSYSRAAQCDLYGTMGAHLAMARLARQFADSP
jgi:hypothetical protein